MIMLTYVLGAVFHTLVSPSVNLNFFLTQPPLFPLWGWVLVYLRHQPYICLIMDIYPDVAVLDGLLKADSFVARFLSRLSIFILKRADRVIAIGRCMAERIAVMGIQRERIQVIPNWANEHLVFPIEPAQNNLRHDLGLTEKFIILYSGNMGVSHYFDDILEVARRCREIEHLKFVFIGAGRRRKEIEHAIAAHNLQNIILLPFQPAERLAESLSLGDVHFISLRSGFEGLVVPSKAYGALAVGRPIIYQGDPRGEIALMVSENEIGRIVPVADRSKLEETILYYLCNPQIVARHGQNALALARGKYSSARALESYAKLLLQPVEI